MADLDQIRAVPLFHGMEAAQLQALAGAFTVEQFSDGHVFNKIGKEGRRERDTLYIVLEGQVAVHTQARADNQVAVDRVMEPGEMFGLITFLRGGARTATTQAAGRVQVAALTHERYEQSIRPDPRLHGAFLFAVSSQLARDVRACNERLVRAIQKTASAST